MQHLQRPSFSLLVCSLAILLSAASCTNKNISSVSNPENIHIVDLDDASKKKEVRLSEYFKSVHPILLEINDDCLISGISTLKVVDSLIVIQDYGMGMGSSSLFVFTKDGKFKHKIGTVGEGPGEYLELSDSSIDFEKKEVYLLDSYSGRINKYDLLTGRFIHSINPAEKGFRSSFIQYLDNKLYISFAPDEISEDSYLLQAIDANSGKQIGTYLKASEYNNGWNIGSFSCLEGFFYQNEITTPKYVEMFMDTIMSIEKDGTVTPYLALQSKDWVSRKDVQQMIEYERNGNYNWINDILHKGNNKYAINSYVECRDFIYFEVFGKESLEYVICDKSTKQSQIIPQFQIKDDILYKKEFSLSVKLAYADEKGVYGYLSTERIAIFLEIAAIQGLNLEPDNKKRLMELSEDSNPVVFYYELRD